MRLKITKSKNAASLYVIKDVIRNGKRTTKIVEKLGTLEDLKKKLKNEDPIEWSKKYIERLNDQEKINTRKMVISFEGRGLSVKCISETGVEVCGFITKIEFLV